MQIKKNIYIPLINQNNYPPKNTAVNQNTKQQCFFYMQQPATGINYFTGNITNSGSSGLAANEFEEEKNNIRELCKIIEEEEELDLSRILKVLNKDNIFLAKKLLEDDTFPRHEVYPIVLNTNKCNLSLSEKLCEDNKVPRYLVSQILKSTTKENLNLAEAMYLTENFPLIMIPSLLYNTEGEKNNFRDQEIKGLPYFAKMYRQCMKNPGMYINSNGSCSNHAHETIYQFFSGYGREILKLASLQDNELNDILLRKRIADMKDSLKIIDRFLPAHLEIIRKGLKCKNPSGKTLTPPEKAELIEIVNDYKLLHKGYNDLESEINNGVIDIKAIKKNIIYDIFQTSVYNDTELNLHNLIPDDKLLSWDLNFAYLLAPQLKKDNNEISAVIKLANQNRDFKIILLDPKEKISQINLLTKEKFEKIGLNYEKWLNPNNMIRLKTADQNVSKTHRIAEQFCMNVNELLSTPAKNFINKKYYEYIEKDGFKLPSEIVQNKSKLKTFMKNFNTSLAQVWRRAETNAENPEPKKRSMALNTLTIKDHIDELINGAANISDNKEIQSVELTVKMWDRFPQHDLFQGNYSSCCIGMNRSNAAAMGTYLTNTTFNMIELIDNTTGKTIGNALCYYIKTKDKPALVIDNIEINNSFLPSELICKQIRTVIAEYAKNINKEVCGDRNIPIYLGDQNNDVPTGDLKRVKIENSEILGQVCHNGNEQIYLDALDGWNPGCDIGKDIEFKNMLQLN